MARGLVMIGTAEQLLSSLPLFGSVPPAALAALAKAGHPVIWPTGKVLFQRGDRSAFLVVMESGHIRISLQTRAGRELVLQHVRGRAVVGEIGVLDGSTRTADATIMAPTVGMMFEAGAFATLIESHPELAKAAIRHLCALLRYTTDHIEGIALYSLEARLARFLLNQSDGGARFALTLNQSEIADLIGASRPKVNQALAALEKDGAIERDGSSIACNREALRRLAGLPEGA